MTQMQLKLLLVLMKSVSSNPHAMETLSNVMHIMIVHAVLRREQKFGALMVTKFVQQRIQMILKNVEALMYAVLEPSHVWLRKVKHVILSSITFHVMEMLRLLVLWMKIWMNGA